MNPESLKYKLYVFDLDDTLYRETDYLFAAYRRIAEFVANGDAQRAEAYYRFLCDTFVNEGRTQLFEKFQAQFGLAVETAQLLDILRHTGCPLHLYEAMRQQIHTLLQQGKRVAVLTNGNVEQQRQKVHNLRLESVFPEVQICYAALIESKPSPQALQYLMQQNGVDASQTLLIGDSDTDRQTARNAGVDFRNIK